MEKEVKRFIKALETKKKVLFLTTSNRWEGKEEIPKSTALAKKIAEQLSETTEVVVLEIPKLKIFPCEGNVSGANGNNCGVKESLLKDLEKDPKGYHRCWASINNKEDELWKVSKELFESEAVVFFISVRWGQANSFYQKLIERLNWIENRHATLLEDNVVSDIEAGCVIIGQNWNTENVLETQKSVYEFYGFKVPEELSFYWQFTQDILDESEKSYKDSPKKFSKDFQISISSLKESIRHEFRRIKKLWEFNQR